MFAFFIMEVWRKEVCFVVLSNSLCKHMFTSLVADSLLSYTSSFHLALAMWTNQLCWFQRSHLIKIWWIWTVTRRILILKHERRFHLPFKICTFCKRRTVSSPIILPQQLCCSHERPRFPSWMPTISTRTPLGWWVTIDMPHMEMKLTMSWTSLRTQICVKCGVSKPVHKCTWILGIG